MNAGVQIHAALAAAVPRLHVLGRAVSAPGTAEPFAEGRKIRRARIAGHARIVRLGRALERRFPLARRIILIAALAIFPIGHNG